MERNGIASHFSGNLQSEGGPSVLTQAEYLEVSIEFYKTTPSSGSKLLATGHS